MEPSNSQAVTSTWTDGSLVVRGPSHACLNAARKFWGPPLQAFLLFPKVVALLLVGGPALSLRVQGSAVCVTSHRCLDKLLFLRVRLTVLRRLIRTVAVTASGCFKQKSSEVSV